METRKTKVTNKPWLCVDSKCCYADVTTATFQRPLHAASGYMVNYEKLLVFCRKKTCYVRRYTTKCGYFQNTTLSSFFKFRDNR